MVFFIAPEEKQGVGQGRSEAQLQVRQCLGFVVLNIPAVALCLGDLEVDKSRSGEGEGGSCGTVVVVEARRARA